jgi:catechol 2,3-dioxygenase
MTATADAAGREFPTPTFQHVTLKTTRKSAMIAWYKTVCGMRLHFENQGGAFMSNDAANHRLALLTIPGVTPDEQRRVHTGLHHMSFEYDELADLDENYRRLRDEGIKPVLCVDHRMTVSYYYADPDDNLVELQIDSFGDAAASTHWMVTELHKITVHPGGNIIDPELVSKDVADGVTREQVRVRAEEGAYAWTAEPPDFRLPPMPAGAPQMYRL